MTPIKPSQLRTLLAQTIPAKEPVLITGKPGVGKTDIVQQACAEALADCLIMHPVVSDPTDFKGLPWVTDGGATFLPFGELQTLINAMGSYRRRIVCDRVCRFADITDRAGLSDRERRGFCAEREWRAPP